MTPYNANIDSQPLRVDVRACKGINTYHYETEIEDNQLTVGNNIQLDSYGRLLKRLGTNRVLNDPGGNAVVALGYFNAPNVDERIIQIQGTGIYDSTSPLATSGNWVDKTGSNTITADQYATDMIICDDRTYFTNARNPVYYHNGAGAIAEGDDTTDPPFCKVGCYHKNRLWLFNEKSRGTATGDTASYTAAAGDKLKVVIDGTTFDDIAMDSDTSIDDAVTSINAASGLSAKGLAWKDSNGFLRISSLTTGLNSSVSVSDGTNGNGGECEDLFNGSTASGIGTENPEFGYYSNALATETFNRSTQVFKVESGDASEITAAISMGDSIIIFKETSVHELVIAGATAAYWNLRPVEKFRGCVSFYCAKEYNGQIYFMTHDGIGIVGGGDLPVMPKTTWDTINWDYVTRSRMTIWDDKLLLAVPTGSTTYPDKVFYYDFVTQGWGVWTGINVGCWGMYLEKTAGEADAGEKALMYGDANDGWVYQIFKSTQFNDVSTAIDFDIETKAYDFGYPDNYKCGGWLMLRIITGPDSGGTAITVSASVDGGSYSTLGTTSATAKYNLMTLGRYKKIKFRFRHNATAIQQISINGFSVETYLTPAKE